MQAIDDYINGNQTDAKRRAKKAGRYKVRVALRNEYGYSNKKTAIIEAYLFDHADWQLTCDRLHALDQQDIEDGFIQEKVGKPFRQNDALVDAAREAVALQEPIKVKTARHTTITMERGVAFFEDGTEASNVSVQLFKAAPQLLALLTDIGRWLEVGLSRGQINRGTANRDGDLVSQIRAAIANASPK